MGPPPPPPAPYALCSGIGGAGIPIMFQSFVHSSLGFASNRPGALSLKDRAVSPPSRILPEEEQQPGRSAFHLALPMIMRREIERLLSGNAVEVDGRIGLDFISLTTKPQMEMLRYIYEHNEQARLPSNLNRNRRSLCA